MGPAQGRLFVFGLGYTSLALVRHLNPHPSSASWIVDSTVRTNSKANDLNYAGNLHHYAPAAGQLLSDDGVAALQRATHVLISVPPVGLPLYDPVLRSMKQLLADHCKDADWMGYLSSTGVYGDSGGEWVDETTEPKPISGRGVTRLEAERALQELHTEQGLPLHVFRLGGIYGPGRSVFEALKKERLSQSQQRRERQKHISRCHVADICQVLAASMARPDPGQVYNVVDDDPAPRADVAALAAQLLGLPEAQADEAAGTRQDSGQAANGNEGRPAEVPDRCQVVEEKRVRNHKIQERLGVRLRYPTYREGLAAIHAGDIAPFTELDSQPLRLC